MRSDSQPPLSIEQIALALSPFTAGLHISSGEMAKIREYVEVLTHWNQVVSLTAVSDKAEIVARHFGESIFAASAVPIHSGRLADVGSGAGFPGLPLKIVSDGLGVVLLEPSLKKCAFLNEVSRKLELNDVEVGRSRYEDYHPGGAPFDFVCSRALGGYRGLLRWARSMLAPDGRVVLWLGEEDSILVGRTPGWSWDLPIRIPESRRRVIQVARPLLE
jgi:16S rRNA (guanine527-N7)-methyltransferase